jgi:hypothetical protein
MWGLPARRTFCLERWFIDVYMVWWMQWRLNMLSQTWLQAVKIRKWFLVWININKVNINRFLPVTGFRLSVDADLTLYIFIFKFEQSTFFPSIFLLFKTIQLIIDYISYRLFLHAYIFLVVRMFPYMSVWPPKLYKMRVHAVGFESEW